MKSSYIKKSMYSKLFLYMQYENVLALSVCLETGMRINDVLQLRKENLHGRTIEYVISKDKKRDKKVISKKLMDALFKNIRNDFVFEGKKQGQARTRQAVWSDIKKAQKAACIECVNISPHSARKTYAVDMFHADGLIATQKALKHDSSNTTLIYALSDVLNEKAQYNDSEKAQNIDIEKLAEIIACKVFEKIKALL